MPYPGVALMVVVGVGLGAFLYYMFSDNQHQYENEGGGCNAPPPEYPNSWTTNQDDSKGRRRKRGSSMSSGKVSCTVCIGELAEEEITKIYPCGHKFHKSCIAEWREQGPEETRNTCPNCRMGISGSSSCNKDE